MEGETSNGPVPPESDIKLVAEAAFVPLALETSGSPEIKVGAGFVGEEQICLRGRILTQPPAGARIEVFVRDYARKRNRNWLGLLFFLCLDPVKDEQSRCEYYNDLFHSIIIFPLICNYVE